MDEGYNEQPAIHEEEYNGQEYGEQHDIEAKEQHEPTRELTSDVTKTNQSRRWSNRHKPTEQLREYMESSPSIKCMGEVMQEEDQTFLTGTEDPICFASPQSDMMYYDQAMKAKDSGKFREAMQKEITTHFERWHWEIKSLKQIPALTKLLDLVWAIWRKWRISTSELYKYKACQNAYGGQQVQGKIDSMELQKYPR